MLETNNAAKQYNLPTGLRTSECLPSSSRNTAWPTKAGDPSQDDNQRGCWSTFPIVECRSSSNGNPAGIWLYLQWNKYYAVPAIIIQVCWEPWAYILNQICSFYCKANSTPKMKWMFWTGNSKVKRICAWSLGWNV